MSASDAIACREDARGATLRSYIDKLTIAERDLEIARSNAVYWQRQHEASVISCQRTIADLETVRHERDRARNANAELAEEQNDLRETIAAHEVTIAELRAGIIADAQP